MIAGANTHGTWLISRLNQWLADLLFAWFNRVGTITGLDYWTHPNCSAEQKLNIPVLIHSVTSLTLLPAVCSWRSKVTCIFNKLHLWWLCLNPVEFTQALSTRRLYQLEGNAYLLGKHLHQAFNW